MQLANPSKLNINKTYLLLLSIFVFAFIYRLFLLLNQTYPPGSDIGFHASVINSITKSGNTNFLWNYYQMGGEIELEFPGYHIFTSALILWSGMPNYLAQAIVAASFSSLTILAVSLVTRLVWSENAALIVALLVTFSPSDIDIVCWGGYPNIVVLLMIPLTFYLFLKGNKLTKTPYLIATSLLTASIFLTHSLSAAIFLAIAAVPLLAVVIVPRIFNESRKTALNWALPILIGALLVSPFLVSAVPIYLNQSTIITSNPAVAQALVNNRTVPFLLVFALFAGVGAFFGLSKLIKGRFFSFSVFIIISWLLVPLLFTQGYLVGLYTDSVRFQFFFSYPAIILLAVMIEYASGRSIMALSPLNFAVAKTKIFLCLNKLTSKLSLKFTRLNSKAVPSVFIAVCLLVLLFLFPVFAMPVNGVVVQRFYQVMDDEGYKAIEWVKQNTPEESVFASDMGFGWWLTGFGQRPTITDIDLQAISLANEVDISRNVSYLLDTDYAIDNGYIQVREDGGYSARHNPLITADVQWANNPGPFIQFNSDNITLFYMNGTYLQSINLSQIPITNTQLINSKTDNPSIVIDRADSAIVCSEILTLSKGLKYANMTYIVQSSADGISLGSLSFLVNSTGVINLVKDSVAIIDTQNNACSQLISVNQQPDVSLIDSQDNCLFQLSYNLHENLSVIQILAGITQLSPEETVETHTNQTEFIQSVLTPSTNLPITTFDYQKALREYNVSYVVNINPEINCRYLIDPHFSIAFQNDRLSIYKVKANNNTFSE